MSGARKEQTALKASVTYLPALLFTPHGRSYVEARWFDPLLLPQLEPVYLRRAGGRAGVVVGPVVGWPGE